jgi:hypothetical protein
MPKEVSLELALPDMLSHLSQADYVAKHDAALTAKVEAAVTEREKSGRRFLGLKKLAQTQHTQRARKPEKSGRDNVIRPRIACSCKELRIQALLRLKAFDEAYTAALRRFLDGERDVVFPAGTYQLRVHYGVRVQASPPT